MALAGPVGKDNLDISFRLQSKAQVFDGSTNALQNAKVSICAAASSLGIVFVGSHNPEILVLCLKDLESQTSLDKNAPIRKVPLPSAVSQMATNCDGSLLAVDVTINGIPHIQLYSVASFLTPSVQKVREFRISNDNAKSTQICWNPVINSTLAVCTSSGGLNLYAMKETGIEFHCIDPALKANCCCWSPKGKQIVVGFGNGKLIQFNLELKPARIIECPQGVLQGGNYQTIAVQWLSTYQFAIALLSQQEESRPVVYILNAPKAGPQQYIAYTEICLSTSEVRPSKIYLQYIPQWGMILVASANCVDVSFLRISKAGDIPEWTQEFPNDQFPAELPLTVNKDESFPVGFEIDTACTGRLLHEDGSQYPVMPMLHMLSTSGVLCSFYIANTTASYVDICSPPRPIDPRVLSQLFTVASTPPPVAATNKDESILKTPSNTVPAPITHSTPASVKTNLFGAPPASTFATSIAPPVSASFGLPAPTTTASNAFSGFSLPTQPSQPLLQTPSNFQFASKPVAVVSTTQSASIAPQPPQNQPLITVPPTYNPSTAPSKPEGKETSSDKSNNDVEDDQVYIRMIQDEMKAFELEFKFVVEKSRSVQFFIGTKEESSQMRRSLEDLDELKKEATETIDSLRSDVQMIRLGLTEMFSMIFESKAKCEHDNKSLIMNQNHDRNSKRKLENLRKMVTQCEMQVQIVVQLLQSQWSSYLEASNKNKKNRMHIPSLEGVYQTLTKQQDIIYRLNGKIKLLKSKLGICDDVKKQKNANINSTIESLSDSIISMSLIDQVKNERSKLSEKKLKNLRNSLANREVVNIKPQRPQLPGLNSEIVIEKRANAIKSLKKKPEQKTETFVAPKPTQVTQQKPLLTIAPQNTTKPPSESGFNVMQQKNQFSNPPLQVQQPQPSLSFGKKPEENTKNASFNFGTSQPSFGNSQSSFGLNLSTGSSFPSTGFGGLSSTPLILGANGDKKKTEVPKLNPLSTAQKEEQKQISNTPIAVSANFSVSLPKPSAVPVAKEIPKAVEEKREEPKISAAPTTTETTSFTFSLPGKKEAAKSAAPSTGISFGSTSSNVSDAAKSAFSFGTPSVGGNAFSFGNPTKPADVKTSTPAPATTGSVFGGSATPFTGFSLNLADTTTKTTPPTLNASSAFSSLTSVTTPPNSGDSKANSPPSIFSTSVTSSVATVATTTSSESKSASSFSFANFGTSIAPSSQTAFSSSTTFSSASILPTKAETSPTASLIPTTVSKAAASADSVLSNLSICSPEAPKSTPTSSTPSNVFGSTTFAPKSDSIFGTDITSSKSSIFGSTVITATTATSQSPSVTTSAQPSIFASQTATSTPTTTSSASLFGSVTTSDKSPSLFNLVKPDQSVFGSTVTTSSTTPASGFGNIFSNVSSTAATPPSSNIFGTPVSPAPAAAGSIFGSQQPASPSTNIFAQTATQPSTGIFGQTPNIFAQSAAPATTTASPGGSIFGQSTFGQSTTSSGSIFGNSSAPQSSFGGASTNIFGSSTQQQSPSIFGGSTAPPAGGSIFGGSPAPAQASSPFGSSNIFAASNNQATFGGNATFSSTFGAPAGGNAFGGGSSIFNQQQQPTFGGGATFGSPKSTNIFGSTMQAPQPVAQSGNIFDQLGSQQSGNLFGSLAQTSPPPQQAPQSGVFSGSAFSSWR